MCQNSQATRVLPLPTSQSWSMNAACEIHGAQMGPLEVSSEQRMSSFVKCFTGALKQRSRSALTSKPWGSNRSSKRHSSWSRLAFSVISWGSEPNLACFALSPGRSCARCLQRWLQADSRRLELHVCACFTVPIHAGILVCENASESLHDVIVLILRRGSNTFLWPIHWWCSGSETCLSSAAWLPSSTLGLPCDPIPLHVQTGET